MRGCPKIISTLKLHRLQQTFAAFPNIAPCGLKITRVPRVGDIARAVRVIHQKADFVLGVFAKHAFQVAEIVAVHGNDLVEIIIILPRHLASRFACATYAVFGKYASRRRIDGIADFLGRSGGRCYLELRFKAGVFHHFLHNEFRHWAAADVSVANEKYLVHFYLNMWQK